MEMHRRRSQQQSARIGEADARLDHLIEMELRARSRSLPADVRGDGGRSLEGRVPDRVEATLPIEAHACGGLDVAGTAAVNGDGGRRAEAIQSYRPAELSLQDGALPGRPADLPRPDAVLPDRPAELRRPVDLPGHAADLQGAGGALWGPDGRGSRGELLEQGPIRGLLAGRLEGYRTELRGQTHGTLIYDGMPQGFDPGQGGWHSDDYAIGYVSRAAEGLLPRQLEYQPQVASVRVHLPQGGQGQPSSTNVNAFWSPETRRQANQELQGGEQIQGSGGMTQPVGPPQSFGPPGVQDAPNLGVVHPGAHQGVQPMELVEPQPSQPPEQQSQAARTAGTDGDVERLRERILQEAEEAFARELRRMKDGSAGSGSYHTATSGIVSGGGAPVQASPQGPRGQATVQPVSPLNGLDGRVQGPGLSPGQGHQGLQWGALSGHPAQYQSQGPSISVGLENLRSQELPSLPLVGPESALLFGDWMAVVFPVMADISPSARQWWTAVVREVEILYDTWLQSTPLERLRLKPEWLPGDENGMRIEQRATSMLLSAIPEHLRKDIIASRKLSTVSILFKLHTIYQPGGGAERNALLRSLTDLKVGASLQELLSSIRSWRRWVVRAGELRLIVPDPLVLMQVLIKMSEVLAKHGGAQVTYRLASVRQELQLDHRPRLEGVLEYAEFIQ